MPGRQAEGCHRRAVWRVPELRHARHLADEQNLVQPVRHESMPVVSLERVPSPVSPGPGAALELGLRDEIPKHVFVESSAFVKSFISRNKNLDFGT